MYYAVLYMYVCICMYVCVHIYIYIYVAQSCPTLCDPMDYAVHGVLQARILKWVAFPLSRGSSQPRNLNQISSIAADSLPAEPQGKPKKTGMGSLSFLQQICLTQISNWGLPHCRWILYHIYQQLLERIYIYIYKILNRAFPGGTSGKEPACQCKRHKRLGLDPWVRKIPWRRKWQPSTELGGLQSMGLQRVGHN